MEFRNISKLRNRYKIALLKYNGKDPPIPHFSQTKSAEYLAHFIQPKLNQPGCLYFKKLSSLDKFIYVSSNTLPFIDWVPFYKYQACKEEKRDFSTVFERKKIIGKVYDDEQ